MIISTASLINSPAFKPGKNGRHLIVDYCNVNAVVTPIKAPIPNIIKITDSIQPATGKYLVVRDLANMFSVYFNSLLDAVCFRLLRDSIVHPIWLLMDYLNFPVIIHNLCRYNLNCIQLSPGAQVCQHTDDIRLQGNSFDTLIQNIQIPRGSQK